MQNFKVRRRDCCATVVSFRRLINSMEGRVDSFPNVRCHALHGSAIECFHVQGVSAWWLMIGNKLWKLVINFLIIISGLVTLWPYASYKLKSLSHVSLANCLDTLFAAGDRHLIQPNPLARGCQHGRGSGPGQQRVSSTSYWKLTK